MADEKVQGVQTRPAMPAGYGIEPAAPDEMLDWAGVCEKLAKSRNYWVATTRPYGRPHVMPVWGLWIDDAIIFSTDPASRKARNLAANPEVVVHLESGDDVVVLEGTAERIQGRNIPASFVDDYDAKYCFRIEVGNADFGFYRLRPRVAFAWREHDFPKSATRWRFDPH